MTPVGPLDEEKVAEAVLNKLKVSWHEIFVFQNMLPINAFIRVALFFSSSLVEIFGSNPKVPKKLVPETWAWISLLL